MQLFAQQRNIVRVRVGEVARSCLPLTRPCLQPSLQRRRPAVEQAYLKSPERINRQEWRLAAAADQPEEKPAASGVFSQLNIFNVFNDPACNQKLLALAIGQMLCSIATLMHDSYLPVYVQDELGLSNTKVSIW